jgi:hypothetical protein
MTPLREEALRLLRLALIPQTTREALAAILAGVMGWAEKTVAP